eukprot:1176523-Prorocentrum_minimum.AAC.4
MGARRCDLALHMIRITQLFSACKKCCNAPFFQAEVADLLRYLSAVDVVRKGLEQRVVVEHVPGLSAPCSILAPSSQAGGAAALAAGQAVGAGGSATNQSVGSKQGV